MFRYKELASSIEVVSIGTVNLSMVYPREIFKVAILTNSSEMICFHNRPMGNTDFSKEDSYN